MLSSSCGVLTNMRSFRFYKTKWSYGYMVIWCPWRNWCLAVYYFHHATVRSGPGPPHYREFTITLRHTTLGTSPLDEWSARCRDFCLQHTPLSRYRHKRAWQDSNWQPKQVSRRCTTAYQVVSWIWEVLGVLMHWENYTGRTWWRKWHKGRSTKTVPSKCFFFIGLF